MIIYIKIHAIHLSQKTKEKIHSILYFHKEYHNNNNLLFLKESANFLEYYDCVRRHHNQKLFQLIFI